MAKCPICDRPLRRKDALYCSRECKAIAESRSGNSYTCETCGAVVHTPPSKATFGSKYCSWRCVPEKLEPLSDWQAEYIASIEASLRRKYTQLFRYSVEPYELEDVASEGVLGALQGIAALRADSSDEERFKKAFAWGLKAAKEYVRKTRKLR